ncbi:2'-5' RNA ligase [Marmoricola sp. OAE513]|uniref:RNA 2',3'-cyclic phosphodiesterase n=1 Tax=Marmoricola sp. OAE513 TaxID=2817894 RepID=UPI001D3E5CF2
MVPDRWLDGLVGPAIALVQIGGPTGLWGVASWSMRMFVAVAPPMGITEDLDTFLDVRRDAAELRWTRPETWHVTLAFLPDVPDRSLDGLVDALAEVAGRRRTLVASVGGAGAFPDVAGARVLWAGVRTDDDEELGRLAAGCRTAAATHGVETLRERFTPHLTLARSRHPFEATRWLRVLDTYRSEDFPVDRFTLFSSHLGEGPGGRPRYDVEAEFLL